MTNDTTNARRSTALVPATESAVRTVAATGATMRETRVAITAKVHGSVELNYTPRTASLGAADRSTSR
jgi:hypothetical protein